MAQLTEMLQVNPAFQTLPTESREIYFRLASEFEDNDLALQLSPTELTRVLKLGNKNLWQQFLQLEVVQSYIKSQMAFDAQIAHRKAFGALQREATMGDTTAAKQINELAGIFNQADNGKVIVMHQIARPKLKPRTEEQTDGNA